MEPGLGLFGISGPEAVAPCVVVVLALIIEEAEEEHTVTLHSSAFSGTK